jgi:uncharacterized protein YcaQ
MVATSGISLREARALALVAQGFAAARPAARLVKRSALTGLARRLSALQIDSVNVLVRSHYLPAFSRLGPYDRDALDSLALGADRALFEYWGHEASLLPVELHPLLRWRMDRARHGHGIWRGVAKFGREQQPFCEAVLEEIRTRGPIGVSELGSGGKRRAGWWGWSHGKIALEWLFWTGQITTHSRRRFERVYDLTERTLPGQVIARPTPSIEDAQRELVRISMRAMSVATERDLRDYFRLPTADAKARISELVEAGELQPAAVEGWKQAAYLDPSAGMAKSPRSADRRALLSPFDSLIWERDRTERLFGFRYRLEIYTPRHRREHGYYVLPFLLGDRLVARVDLKSDRLRSTLRVLRAHLEPDVSRDEVTEPLREELQSLGRWLGLERLVLSRQRAVRHLLA